MSARKEIMNYWNEIAVIAVLILLNALLSMAEAALVAGDPAAIGKTRWMN